MTFSDDVDLTYDGVGVYARALPLSFEANADVYAGQAVKLTGDELVEPATEDSDGIGVAAYGASSGDQIGVYPPGSIVYGAAPTGESVSAGALLSAASGSAGTAGYLDASATGRTMAMALQGQSGNSVKILLL